MPKLKKMREDAAKRAERRRDGIPKAESTPHATDANPKHREDFESLLGKAAKPTASKDK